MFCVLENNFFLYNRFKKKKGFNYWNYYTKILINKIIKNRKYIFRFRWINWKGRCFYWWSSVTSISTFRKYDVVFCFVWWIPPFTSLRRKIFRIAENHFAAQRWGAIVAGNWHGKTCRGTSLPWEDTCRRLTAVTAVDPEQEPSTTVPSSPSPSKLQSLLVFFMLSLWMVE